MAWTRITRGQYRRDGLRDASDTTDAEWAIIEPHMPPLASCGRPRETSLRAVVNAIFYIAQTGCQWRMLPPDEPSTDLSGCRCRTPKLSNSHARDAAACAGRLRSASIRTQIGTLVVATSLVQLANGFFGTFFSLRVAIENFDVPGLVLSAYFAGFTWVRFAAAGSSSGSVTFVLTPHSLAWSRPQPLSCRSWLDRRPG